MEHEGNLFEGVLWGTLLSMPLWLAIIGWVKITLSFL